MIVPTREHLDAVKRLTIGERYVGRGSRQRNLPKSRFCNIYKVAEHGRASALRLYQLHLDSSAELKRSIWTLSGCRLLCHCTKAQDCHADTLFREFKRQFPDAYDRSVLGQAPPPAKVFSFLAQLRCEPERDDGSAADEGAPPKGSGFCGRGSTMQVGLGYDDVRTTEPAYLLTSG